MEGVASPDAPEGSPLDPMVQARNHDPEGTWDPVLDYQMMSRNLRGFMSLFHSDKPTVTKVHGYCVAGGTDMALCSDLIVAEDRAKIGYPPARVWGVPTSALWAFRVGPARAKRLLLTGDSIDGTHRGRVGSGGGGGAGRRARRALRGASRSDRPGTDQPTRHAQAARSTRRSTRRACRPPRSSASSSTASPGTPPRGSPSSDAPPRPGSSRPSASGTNPSEISGSIVQMAESYDAIVIGAGVAGVVCAEDLAAGGMKVAICERELVAGECGYWACIPSKTLLRPGEVLSEARQAPGAREAISGPINVKEALGWRNFQVSDWDDSHQAETLTEQRGRAPSGGCAHQRAQRGRDRREAARDQAADRRDRIGPHDPADRRSRRARRRLDQPRGHFADGDPAAPDRPRSRARRGGARSGPLPAGRLGGDRRGRGPPAPERGTRPRRGPVRGPER